ncbi:MAG TPA: hypothetical protein VL866_08955 [Pyrinomonadaceae bacterium]|nr:hypothetical protein [Pyrinomonadaceae bacterium]
MNLWLWFWMISLLVAGSSFALITVVVTIKGAGDLKSWFRSLQQQNKE